MVFLLGVAGAVFSLTRLEGDTTPLPWFEVDCRYWIFRGGDPGVVADFTVDGMRFVIPVLDPHWPTRHDHTIIFDDQGEVLSVELDWENFQKAMSLTLEYDGGTRRMMNRLRREVRGLRVDMRAKPLCHDKSQLGSGIRARIDAQRPKGSR